MIEILILIILWGLTNAISCGVGYYFAAKSKRKPKPKSNPQPTDYIQVLKAVRAAAEVKNLYSYNGDEQKEINADVR